VTAKTAEMTSGQSVGPHPPPLDIRKSWRTSLALFLGSGGVLIVCITSVFRSSRDAPLFVLLGIAACAFALVALLNLTDRSVQVALDATHITPSTHGSRLAYASIRKIRYHDDSLNVGHFVEFDLEDAQRVRITTASSFIALELTASELYEAIKARLTPEQVDQILDEGALDGNTLESSVLTGNENEREK